jgi:hypothetical protein
MVVGFTTIQSVPITTNIVSLNPARGKVYSIQHYVIKFVNKTNLHDISEILLKVAFNTITPKTDKQIKSSEV